MLGVKLIEGIDLSALSIETRQEPVARPSHPTQESSDLWPTLKLRP